MKPFSIKCGSTGYPSLYIFELKVFLFAIITAKMTYKIPSEGNVRKKQGKTTFCKYHKINVI